MDPFFQRLKERKLVQWAIAYLAGAWVLYEVVDTVGDRWGLPDVFFQGLFVVLAIGFFVVLVLAWYHGEKGRQRVSGPELLIVTLLLVVGGSGISLLGKDEEEAEASWIRDLASLDDDRPTIAVLPVLFQNPPDVESASLRGFGWPVRRGFGSTWWAPEPLVPRKLHPCGFSGHFE